MADSAPDPKVEDVLSSVRRLVSQELPKRPATKPAPDAGALVLTSQDRIEADPKARVDQRSLEQRIAELEAAVDSGVEEFEPDGSEDQAQHRPDRIVFTRPRPSEAEIGRPRTTLRLSEIALIETGPASDGDDDADTPVQFRHGQSANAPDAPRPEDVPEAPMATDVPTTEASSAEVHAFSDPDDVVARIEARIERGEDVPPPAQPVEDSSAGDSDFDAELSAAVHASLAASAATDEAADSADTLSADEAVLTEVSEAPEANEPFVEADPGDEEPDEAQVSAVVRAPGADATEAPVTMVEEAPEAEEPFVEVDPGDEEPGEALVSTVVNAPSADATEAPAPVVEEPTEAVEEEASPSAEAVRPTVDTPAEAPETEEAPVAEADELPAGEDDAEPDEQAPAEVAAAALGALPDEDAMRLLVSRLLREELQGDLGERITRNVRKLVRSEIMRVLQSRELD